MFAVEYAATKQGNIKAFGWERALFFWGATVRLILQADSITFKAPTVLIAIASISQLLFTLEKTHTGTFYHCFATLLKKN